MKEYQEVKRNRSFMEMCKDPEIASEVTMQPVRALGVDAAILFSDILVPVESMGREVEFVPQVGPRLPDPVRTMDDVESLVIPDPEEAMPFVLEAINLAQKKLGGRVPLIGFSGAPFTLASYLIEGGGSRDFRFTKEMMFSRPEAFELLMEKLGKTVLNYLNSQIAAGVDAVQIFDSWVGTLAPEDYEGYVMSHTKKIFSQLDGKGEVPSIYFANQASTFLELAAEAGGDVVGVDWRIPLDEAWKKVGSNRAIQGNLDPMALFAPPEEIERRVKEILSLANGREGHIFNLGHGVHKDTSVDKVKMMVEVVKKYRKR